MIYGECPYKSPTDMGVNMAGNCIVDDEACREASPHGDPAPLLHRLRGSWPRARPVASPCASWSC